MLEKIKCPERDSNPRHPDLMIFSSICSVYIDRHIRVDLCDDEQQWVTLRDGYNHRKVHSLWRGNETRAWETTSRCWKRRQTCTVLCFVRVYFCPFLGPLWRFSRCKYSLQKTVHTVLGPAGVLDFLGKRQVSLLRSRWHLASRKSVVGSHKRPIRVRFGSTVLRLVRSHRWSAGGVNVRVFPSRLRAKRLIRIILASMPTGRCSIFS